MKRTNSWNFFLWSPHTLSSEREATLCDLMWLKSNASSPTMHGDSSLWISSNPEYDTMEPSKMMNMESAADSHSLYRN